jgi:hypothetical protein
MNAETPTHIIEWNCMADGGRRISTIELAIPLTTDSNALHGMARRCLLAYFEDDDGDLPALLPRTDTNRLPDEVIIRNRADDLPIYRWTYVDEMIARFQKRSQNKSEKTGASN